MRERFLAQLEAPAPPRARALRPAMMLAAAALLMTALAAALWWSRERTPRPDVPRQASSTTVPRSEPPSPPQTVVALRLTPGQTMGAGCRAAAGDAGTGQRDLAPGAGPRAGRLRELPGAAQHRGRRAVAGGPRQAVAHGGGLDARARGARASIGTPSSPTTDYRVRLFGERDGRGVEAVASYSFRVSGPRHSP